MNQFTWDAMSAIFTMAATLIALYLLAQGQGDRRVLRRIKEREQAVRVMAWHEDSWTSLSESSAVLAERIFYFRNDSDLPVDLTHVEYVTPSLHSIESHREDERLEWDRLVIRPGGEWHRRFEHDHPYFAIMEFTDTAGARWRRRTDTSELQEIPRPIRWWQRAFQTVCRVRVFYWPLLGIWERQAVRRVARDGPDQVPWQVKYARFMFGYWGPGEPDEWKIPFAAPPLWEYEELYWGDNLKRLRERETKRRELAAEQLDRWVMPAFEPKLLRQPIRPLRTK